MSEDTPKQAVGGDRNPIAPGDVVRLRSGGPYMTVGAINLTTSANGPMVHCYWQVEGRPHDSWFVDKTLEQK